MTFDDLGLTTALLRAVKTEGYSIPTPIQQQAIGHVLEGRDLLGVAQTGTGKTAAFALPILQRLGDNGGQARVRGRKARVLVLSPTRELATQIAESFSTYGRHTGLRQTCIYGGVSQHPQAKAVRDGVDILVATPGRLMDLMNQGLVTLGGIEILVIDEADRMFDMGFIRDIQKIVAKLTKKRQTLLFSATMPADIRQLADKILSNPVRVQIESKNAAADLVEQSVYFVDKRNKPALLKHFIEQAAVTRALVFTRTKHGADKVAKHLSRAGIRAEAIHGDKTQAARQRALVNFKSAKPPILVATDVAARGLDIDDVSHVVNYDMPNVAETYVHRIGRTGRAGATGIAVSFCDHDEREHLRDIEKLLRKKTPVCTDHPEYAAAKEPAAGAHGSAKSNRPSAPPQRKPHAAGPADDRHRSRRRKFGPTAKASPQGYTTMW
jgi:ATP-dependent RNA helicase RhlE